MLDLAIIIVSYNTKDLTLKCINSIYKNKPKNKFEILLVDNNSTDDTVFETEKLFPEVNIIKSRNNLGFAGGNNLALKRISAKNYLLLNSDTEVATEAINRLLEFANNNNFAVSSCRLIDKKRSFQPNAGELPNFATVIIWLSGLDDIFRTFLRLPSYQERNNNYYEKDRQVGWVGGTAMMIKGELFKKIGYLDDKIFMYGEDVEFCLRAKRYGYKTGWTSAGEIMHLGGGSLKEPHFSQWRGEFKSLIYIFDKYYGFLASLILRMLIYFFVFLRIICFSILGKINFSKTYAKILISF